ncbi:hypothetical protein [uncultured Chryseobacterium sp.]|uniref:hypothetical protein n=1 Tax=uncultured Chryseobacterium sp. TaxID=259322 RepID=UPI0025FC6A2D|nr:hypothetical protein [uncultured Chryseobacterium sp.]
MPNIKQNIGTAKRADILFIKLLIALGKTEDDINKIKIIISLRKLLERGKNLQKNVVDNKIIYSYHTISTNALIRKATVNDTLNGNTSPTAITLISIIGALGFTMADFGEAFDSITDKDIREYLKS